MPVVINGTTGITTPSINVANGFFTTNVNYSTSGFAFANSTGHTAMSLNNLGHMNRPYQPMFSAYNRATTTHSTVKNTWGSLYTNLGNWNTPAWYDSTNVGGYFNTTNGTFTTPTAGYYLFTYHMSAQIFNSSYISFWKNGTYWPPYCLMYEYNAAASGTSYYVASTLSYIFYMSVGDTMTGGCYFASNSWSSYPFNDGYVTLTGTLVG